MQCSRDVAWCSIEVLRNTEASMRYHAQPHWRNFIFCDLSDSPIHFDLPTAWHSLLRHYTLATTPSLSKLG